MSSSRRRLLVRVWLTLLLGAPAGAAQRMEGELVVLVRDSSGLPVQAQIELSSWVSRFHGTVTADAEGSARFRRLPLGLYRLEVAHSGFQPHAQPVEIRSALPVAVTITLDVAPIETSLTVRAAPPLLDPNQTGGGIQTGRQQLDEAPFSTLGRGTIEAVNSLPGWLLEANAVLHPRGSEYDTQYVVDGMPVYDNRSIAFAPAFEVDEFETVNVMTAGFPAEYGRRLGGVIELNTRRAARRGHHPEISTQGGSFRTAEGSLSNLYQGRTTSFSLGVRAGGTDRYLDPPSIENFTNRGTSSGFTARIERDLTANDRLSVYVRSSRVGFLVPNDLDQQRGGQRQDRRGAETAGQLHYQHVFSPRSMAVVRGMAREVSAALWSNALSTPVAVDQDRGIREGAFNASVAYETERHTIKFGGDLRIADVRESFRFADSGAAPAPEFSFDENRRGSDVGLFIQDHVRLGALALDVGVRFDRHSLLIKDMALSPRLAAAYYWRAADLVVRGAYDRVFQTPPLENLLLSSSAQAASLDQVVGALAVPGSRGNFVELGIRKSFADVVRLDVAHYWRNFDNYYDDDVFLNTGIGFPISFASAAIEGTEARLELPRFRGFSSFLSYSNMRGTATSPVTGGLFIQGGEAVELRETATTFAITQDQRNTVSAMLRFEPHSRVWLTARARYGSGLPIELESDGDDDDDQVAAGQNRIGEYAAAGQDDQVEGGFGAISPAILERVNLERGRVRPNFSLDFSLGLELWRQAEKSLTLQVDVINAGDRLNVINFTGIFSGTALAPPRMVGVKLRARF